MFFFCMIWAPCCWQASVRIGNNSATSSNMSIMLGATMGFYKQPISISVIKCVEQLLDNARHMTHVQLFRGMMHICLVGGLEDFLFFHILGIFIPTDFHIFQRGWTSQKRFDTNGWSTNHWTDMSVAGIPRLLSSASLQRVHPMAWKNREPMDTELQGGAPTTIGNHRKMWV